MSKSAQRSASEIETVPSLTSALDHTAGGSVEHGSEKRVDVHGRIEEEEDDKAASLEHDEEVQEDDDVDRAARNNAVRTNYPRG